MLFEVFRSSVFPKTSDFMRIIKILLTFEYFSNGKMSVFYFFLGKNNKDLQPLLILKINVTGF
ncbi:MAG TPA: hypothetical protein DEO32_02095 [Ruminococcaceae bacterium]|nr:hypothetical protein [Oscillospiraceae bacterium]